MRNPGSTRETIRGTRRTGQDTFLRMAFMTMLLDIVCGSRKPAVILDGLTTVMRDQFPADLATYKVFSLNFHRSYYIDKHLHTTNPRYNDYLVYLLLTYKTYQTLDITNASYVLCLLSQVFVFLEFVVSSVCLSTVLYYLCHFFLSYDYF